MPSEGHFDLRPISNLFLSEQLIVNEKTKREAVMLGTTDCRTKTKTEREN
jgi:hypothetical protein